jgi:hypothetical protein
MNLFCLGSAQIDALWDEFAHHVYRLERLGHLDAEELRDDLKQQKKQLWGAQENGKVLGIAITRIGGGTCEIYAAAGTQTAAGQITSLYERIEQWAREKGCVRMKIVGRKGWLRMLKGYRPAKAVILEKELVHGI